EKKENYDETGDELRKAERAKSIAKAGGQFPFSGPMFGRAADFGGGVDGDASGSGEEKNLEQGAVHVLVGGIAAPVAEESEGNEPVGEKDGDGFFDEACGRRVVVHPTEMDAEEAGDDPRAVFVERAAVGKNGGEFEHGVPEALQVILKCEVDGEQ